MLAICTLILAKGHVLHRVGSLTLKHIIVLSIAFKGLHTAVDLHSKLINRTYLLDAAHLKCTHRVGLSLVAHSPLQDKACLRFARCLVASDGL